MSTKKKNQQPPAPKRRRFNVEEFCADVRAGRVKITTWVPAPEEA